MNEKIPSSLASQKQPEDYERAPSEGKDEERGNAGSALILHEFRTRRAHERGLKTESVKEVYDALSSTDMAVDAEVATCMGQGNNLLCCSG